MNFSCSNCKTLLPEGARFCPNCGARFEKPVGAGAGGGLTSTKVMTAVALTIFVLPIFAALMLGAGSLGACFLALGASAVLPSSLMEGPFFGIVLCLFLLSLLGFTLWLWVKWMRQILR